MKKKIYILGLTFLMLGVIGASIASAGIDLAETSDYDSANGKKLIFYGEVINEITIWWRDFNNHSNFRSVTDDNLSQSVYHFTISEDDTWNATYIEWEVTIVDFWDVTYEFAGGFSTIEPYVDVELIDYDRIESMSNEMKAEIFQVLLGNSSFMQQFENLGDNIKSSVTNSISTFNEGLVTEMRGLGYSDSQISEMKNLISTGFQDTIRTEREQRLDVLRAEQRGWMSGVQFILIFIVVAVASLFIWFFVKGRISLPNISILGRGKKKQAFSTDDFFN